MANPRPTPQPRPDPEDEPRIPEEQQLVGAVPPEPNSADEAAEATAITSRTGRTREGRAIGKSDDASGLAVDDERRGEQRRRDAERGATDISSMD